MSTGNECNDTDVRLVDGESQLEGRVEICFGGIWGTICSNSHDDIELASVVCRQLEFSPWSKHKTSTLTPTVITYLCICFTADAQSHSFGAGTGPIFLDNIQCSGSELLLADCSHPEVNVFECTHLNDIGVICEGND